MAEPLNTTDMLTQEVCDEVRRLGFMPCVGEDHVEVKMASVKARLLLFNLRRHVASKAPAERQMAIQQYVQQMLRPFLDGWSGPAQFASFKDVLPTLRLQVHDRLEFGSPVKPEPDMRRVGQRVGPDLYWVVASDGKDVIWHPTTTDLEQWGVTEAEAFAKAQQQSDQLIAQEFEREELANMDGLFIIHDTGGYAATRATRPWLGLKALGLKRIPEAGALVGLPARDVGLIWPVVPAQVPQHAWMMAQFAGPRYKTGDHPVSPMVWWVDPRGQLHEVLVAMDPALQTLVVGLPESLKRMVEAVHPRSRATT